MRGTRLPFALLLLVCADKKSSFSRVFKLQWQNAGLPEWAFCRLNIFLPVYRRDVTTTALKSGEVIKIIIIIFLTPSLLKSHFGYKHYNKLISLQAGPHGSHGVRSRDGFSVRSHRIAIFSKSFTFEPDLTQQHCVSHFESAQRASCMLCTGVPCVFSPPLAPLERIFFRRQICAVFASRSRSGGTFAPRPSDLCNRLREHQGCSIRIDKLNKLDFSSPYSHSLLI